MTLPEWADKMGVRPTSLYYRRKLGWSDGRILTHLILIPTPTSAYNDSHMVCQSLPKELRDQGKKGPIVGNAKILKSGVSGQRGGQRVEKQKPEDDGSEPF